MTLDVAFIMGILKATKLELLMKKDSLSIFRLSVRTGWRFGKQLLQTSPHFLAQRLWSAAGLFSSSFALWVCHYNSLAEIKINSNSQPFYLGMATPWQGWFYHAPLSRSITVGLVVCLSLGSGLNSLFTKTHVLARPRSQCHQLDRSLSTGIAVAAWPIQLARNQRDCLSAWLVWPFFFIPLSIMIWRSPLYPVCWAKKASVCSLFSSLLTVVKLGKPACTVSAMVAL